MTLAETTRTEQRAHPVVLTPGDPDDTQRLAVAINTVRLDAGTPSVLFTAAFAARVLAALAADDTVDAIIVCSCQGEERAAREAERERAETRAADAEATATRYNTVIGRLHTELDQARNTIHRQGDQAAELAGLRDQWIARAVRAEDALQAAEHIDEADDQPEQAEAAEAAEVAAMAVAPLAVPRILASCARCGRSYASHFLILGHRFQPKEQPTRA